MNKRGVLFKRGYIGIISLVITASIIIFLMVKMLQREVVPAEGGDNLNEGYIQAAENAKNLLESQNKSAGQF